MAEPTFVPFAPRSTQDGQEVLEITDAAQRQLLSLLNAEPDTAPRTLRLSVVGGGCSGLSYSLEMTESLPTDHVEDREWVRLAIDASAVDYIAGTTLDFDGGLNGRGFVFQNPNAKRSCSCGDSFGV